MQWYYAEGQQQRGPVSDAELESLIRDGTVTGGTLLWREGMAEWQPLSKVHSAAAVAGSDTDQSAPPHSSTVGTTICSQCGKSFPPEEIIAIEGKSICAGCKPVYVQKLKEGVATQPERERLERVLAVAKAQKGVIWCLLAGMVSYGGMFLFSVLVARTGQSGPPVVITLIPQLAVLIVLGFQVVFVYRLASALQVGTPIIWVLGVLCLSCVGLLIMLILSNRANRTIRDAGFKVGIMGADLNEIRAAM